MPNIIYYQPELYIGVCCTQDDLGYALIGFMVQSFHYVICASKTSHSIIVKRH